LTAQTGTYEVKGSEVTVRPLAQKDPAPIGGTFNTRTFKIDGNTLTLIDKMNANGPVANPAPGNLRALSSTIRKTRDHNNCKCDCHSSQSDQVFVADRHKSSV